MQCPPSFNAGESWRVIDLCPDISRTLRQRLLALGFLPKTIFKILQVAPLGEPYIIEICGRSLCLRKKEMEYFELKKLSIIDG